MYFSNRISYLFPKRIKFKTKFNSFFRNAQAAPPQPPTGPLNPPAGSYNPTSNTENGRRRSRRSEDESTGGPKNRYGTFLICFSPSNRFTELIEFIFRHLGDAWSE